MHMPFGKYRGVPLEQVPLDYLEWLVTLRDLREPLRSAVKCEWQSRQEPPPSPSRLQLPAPVAAAALAIISAGYRSLARSFHPDAGGAHGPMVSLNQARDALRDLLAPGACP